jgi:hypothetical protein
MRTHVRVVRPKFIEGCAKSCDTRVWAQHAVPVSAVDGVRHE